MKTPTMTINGLREAASQAAPALTLNVSGLSITEATRYLQGFQAGRIYEALLAAERMKLSEQTKGA